MLQDTTTGLQIILDHDLPADGYRQLLTLDLSPFRLGPLHYDHVQHRWRSELDEAAPAERTSAASLSRNDPHDSPLAHTLPAANPVSLQLATGTNAVTQPEERVINAGEGHGGD